MVRSTVLGASRPAPAGLCEDVPDTPTHRVDKIVDGTPYINLWPPIDDDARQLEMALALIRRCLVCRADVAHLRAGARICGDARGHMLSRLMRSRRCPVL